MCFGTFCAPFSESLACKLMKDVLTDMLRVPSKMRVLNRSQKAEGAQLCQLTAPKAPPPVKGRLPKGYPLNLGTH